jgi:c-di-GMP-binding flagellar brake protein YcgR
MSDQERRRFPRVPVNFVTVEVISPGDQAESPEFCFVINLSENGMMFRGQRDYLPGQMIMLTFALPDKQETIIRTKALIVHKQELENSRFFGTQFRELGIAEHRQLRSYINSFIKNEPT